MKKLIKYILIAIIIVVAIPSKQFELSDLIKEFNFNNVVNSYYTNTKVDVKNATVIKNGSAYIIESDYSNSNEIKKQLNNIQGQSVSFGGTYNDYLNLKTNLINNIYICDELLNIKTCYGYNSKLTNSVNIDGNNINIQIAYSEGKIIIGTPVILGSF